MRNVGDESKKTYQQKLDSGFFQKYMSGVGAEAGASGYTGTTTILDTATPINLDTPGYDGLHLPFSDNTLDYFYASHVLEHVSDYKSTIKEWFRVLKVGGFLVLVLPHQWLYERKENLPSRWNEDHKRMYKASDLCREIEESLEINSFRIRHLKENDASYDYSITDLNIHPVGEYEVEIVVEKIK